MADGVTFQTTTLASPPDALKVATDDTGATGHVQLFKLAIATDGSATLVPADATDGLLVNLGANNDVTVTGTVTANAGSGPFPVNDNSGSLTVDAPVGTPVFVRLSDGSSAITTLPVSIAAAVAVTDNSGSLTVDNAGTFAVQAALTTPVTSSSATVTDDTTVTTTAESIASNANREGLLLSCPTTNTDNVYFRFGGTASSSSWTHYLAPGDAWEMGPNVYSGAVSYVAGSGTQTLHFTEW